MFSFFTTPQSHKADSVVSLPGAGVSRQQQRNTTTTTHQGNHKRTSSFASDNSMVQKHDSGYFDEDKRASSTNTSMDFYDASVRDCLNCASIEDRNSRKILDLEISNTSLMAVNSSLEDTIRVQATQIENLKRTIASAAVGNPTLKNSNGDISSNTSLPTSSLLLSNDNHTTVANNNHSNGPAGLYPDQYYKNDKALDRVSDKIRALVDLTQEAFLYRAPKELIDREDVEHLRVKESPLAGGNNANIVQALQSKLSYAMLSSNESRSPSYCLDKTKFTTSDNALLKQKESNQEEPSLSVPAGLLNQLAQFLESQDVAKQSVNKEGIPAARSGQVSDIAKKQTSEGIPIRRELNSDSDASTEIEADIRRKPVMNDSKLCKSPETYTMTSSTTTKTKTKKPASSTRSSTIASRPAFSTTTSTSSSTSDSLSKSIFDSRSSGSTAVGRRSGNSASSLLTKQVQQNASSASGRNSGTTFDKRGSTIVSSPPTTSTMKPSSESNSATIIQQQQQKDTAIGSTSTSVKANTGRRTDFMTTRKPLTSSKSSMTTPTTATKQKQSKAQQATAVSKGPEVDYLDENEYSMQVKRGGGNAQPLPAKRFVLPRVQCPDGSDQSTLSHES